MGFDTGRLTDRVIPLVYGQRIPTFCVLLLVTVFLGWHAVQLRPDPGFGKQVPLQHPYMQVFQKYQKAFGGANLISIAVLQKPGAATPDDLYNEHFLAALKQVTDEVFFLPGVDRSRVTSLFTPGVRFTEVVEGGIAGGDVIPRDYQPSPEMFARIRDHVAKAGLAGRLVSLDQRGALVVAELLERDPSTGANLDYAAVAAKLEAIRTRHSDASLDIRIIGFAKVVGDVSDASREVLAFFGAALVLTWLLLWAFCGSFRLSLLPLSAALAAVVWELGLLQLCGYGLDPFAILVPFLILSIAVSHGVQYVNGWGHEVTVNNHSSLGASIGTFRRLFIPGTVAILTNVIGFATLAFIHIEMVREMAINAALGMAAVIVTNKLMLPIALSWISVPDVEKFRRRQCQRDRLGDRLWKPLADFAAPRFAIPALGVALCALAWALWMYPTLTVGDTQPGVPELRPDGRYNTDAFAIARNFAVGVDVLKVIGETRPYGCVSFEAMETIARYTTRIQDTGGVLSAVSLPRVAERIRAGWNEGAPKWEALPHGEAALAQIVNPVPSSAGLANPDCSAMPIQIYTTDHRAETIARLVDETKRFEKENADGPVRFRLASGNVGVMAATNEEIHSREILVIVWVHLTLLVFVWLSFRSAAGVVAIITPLVLCSLLTYGGMALIGIGMKAATLPVAAFGVGIGVDDGIYLWSVLAGYLAAGLTLRDAYFEALRHVGKAVVFTSLSLIVAVVTWLFSDLQFQADMGLLLLFMFTTNLFGAMLLLPALSWLCLGQPAK